MQPAAPPVATPPPAPPPEGTPAPSNGGAAPPPPPPPSAAAAPASAGRSLTLWQSITPLGRSAAAAAVLAWLLAAAFGWEELAVIATACALALLVGVAFLLAGRANLVVQLELGTPRVVVGDPATSRVEATNAANRRMLPVRLEARVGRSAAHLDVPSLGPHASHEELLVIPTNRRSIVPVGPVRSVQGDPLGLVRREITWTGSEDLFVHPRTAPVPPLTTGWMRDLEGEATNDRSPSDVAFHTLREYVIGDDRRHIHWRTTARHPEGKLMVREFVDTRRAHVALVLSLRPDDYRTGEEFELAVSCLASLGVRTLGDEQELTCLVGNRLAPTFHGATFLDTLAGIELGQDDGDVGSIVRRGRDHLAGASVAAVVSGSRADAEVLRGAAEEMGARTRSLIVVAEPGAESTIRSSSGAPTLHVGALDELPRLVWAVTS